MEETRENKLANLRAKMNEHEELSKRDQLLGQELNEFQQESVVK